MSTVKIKGHDISFTPAKKDFNRLALAYKNKLISALEELGVKRDDVELELDGYCGRDTKASVTWFHNGHRMYYEIATQPRYVDNVYLVSQVITSEVALVLADKKPLQEFINEYQEDEDVHEDRKAAREFFGLDHGHKDLEEINKRYKDLAKTHHPDTPTGNVEKFKELNHHHKILKRELE